MLIAVLLLGSACPDSKSSPAQAASAPAGQPVAAKEEAAPQATPDSAAANAQPLAQAAENAADKPCIVPGTYAFSTDPAADFYLLDSDTMKLPPPGKRKKKESEIHDCTGESVSEAFMIALTDGKPTIAFSPDSLGDFAISDVHVGGCRLRFVATVDGEIWHLYRGEFEVTFPADGRSDEIMGKIKNVELHTRLDGEAGEDTVLCGAEEAAITVSGSPSAGPWRGLPEANHLTDDVGNAPTLQCGREVPTRRRELVLP